jgi:hypothetical protein
VLDERELSPREQAFWTVVRSSNENDEGRRATAALEATRTLSPDEFYLATLVVSLFQFYNSFVDLNGVAELSAAGYEASGIRLSTIGYAPVSPAPPPRSGGIAEGNG